MKNASKEIDINGIKEIFILERFVEEICDFYNINNEYFGNILLATTEAATILLSLNDISEKGKLLVRFDRSPKGLMFKIRVTDEGNSGINEDILDQEIRKHKLSKEIFIVKALADEITISLSGKDIVLIFYVSSMNYEKSLLRINKLKEYWEQRVAVSPNKNG
jgi:hypothetical protein